MSSNRCIRNIIWGGGCFRTTQEPIKSHFKEKLGKYFRPKNDPSGLASSPSPYQTLRAFKRVKNCTFRDFQRALGPKKHGVSGRERGVGLHGNSLSTSRYDQIAISVPAGPISGLAEPALPDVPNRLPKKTHSEKKVRSSKTAFTKSRLQW